MAHKGAPLIICGVSKIVIFPKMQQSGAKNNNASPFGKALCRVLFCGLGCETTPTKVAEDCTSGNRDSYPRHSPQDHW